MDQNTLIMFVLYLFFNIIFAFPAADEDRCKINWHDLIAVMQRTQTKKDSHLVFIAGKKNVPKGNVCCILT